MGERALAVRSSEYTSWISTLSTSTEEPENQASVNTFLTEFEERRGRLYQSQKGRRLPPSRQKGVG